MYSFKGQSAIEYLVTYGWMLIAVSIVSGAIFSTVGGECPETASGFVGQDIDIEDFGSGDDLELVLQNTAGDGITVEEVEIRDADTEEVRVNSDDTDIDVGGTGVIGVTAVEETDECNNLEVDITYSIGDSLTGQVATGTLTTSTELIDLDPPAAPEGLNVNY